MTLFEQFIFIYFISTTALAGFAVLWRNWLEDHQNWADFLRKYLGSIAKAFTCGSCFTFWATLAFVVFTNPLGMFFAYIPPFAKFPFPILYFFQWMSLAWGALFFRFLYITLQEAVSIMVHQWKDRDHR